MTIFLVDDEPLVTINMELLLRVYPDAEILLKSDDPRFALEQACELHPDVIFLDINMPQMDGLTFARTLQERQVDAKIVFVTAYADYALDSYDYNTVDYLLKPVPEARLKRTMAKLQQALNAKAEDAPAKKEDDHRITVLRNDRYYMIDLRTAQYVYVQGRRLTIVADDVEYQLKNTLSYWIEYLEKQGWMQVHRSYIINLTQIESISPLSNSVYNVRMKRCSEVITVSRSFIARFRQMVNF